MLYRTVATPNCCAPPAFCRIVSDSLIKWLGFFVIVQVSIESRQVTKVGNQLRMLRPPHFFIYEQRSPVKRFRSEVSALASVELSQIIENRRGLRICRSESLLGDGQQPPVQRFRLRKLSLDRKSV